MACSSHPVGRSCAGERYVIDGQPGCRFDQRNKVFSTSIPANAIQSMEVISGSPQAEYGDKTSLIIINATTRSGLGQKPAGSLIASYGSFGAVGEDATLGLGGARWGNFLAANTERSGRFLIRLSCGRCTMRATAKRFLTASISNLEEGMLST